MPRRALGAFAALALTLAAASPAAAQESAKDVIAAHIRTQGYACAKALSATRQPRASLPDQQAWVLKCSNAAYFVRLVPDMAAEVAPLDASTNSAKDF